MVMAYSPLGQGPILRKPGPQDDRRQGTAAIRAAIALAWVLRQARA